MSHEELGAGIFTSSIGRKLLMASTGGLLAAFVTFHALGNLQIYFGSIALNHYAANLRQLFHGAGLWATRGLLGLALVVHVGTALLLMGTERSARPIPYRQRPFNVRTLPSKTMRWTGVLLACFILYHILHLTLGQWHPSFIQEDVYHNVLLGLGSPPTALAYLGAQVCLALHLGHGLWSLTQTFGLGRPRYAKLQEGFARSVACLIALTNLSFPVAVLTRLLR